MPRPLTQLEIMDLGKQIGREINITSHSDLVFNPQIKAGIHAGAVAMADALRHDEIPVITPEDVDS